MINYRLPHGGPRRSALALFALLVHASAATDPATSASEKNKAASEPLIVSALKVPRDPSTVASTVAVLDPVALLDRGTLQLRDALNEAPGVVSISSAGQTGGVGSLFIRGTSTRYAQVVVDGMRLSNSNNQLGNILSAARVYDTGSIEVLRGPQGAIYGGESIGGVLWLETPHGCGPLQASATVEAGSFNSLSSYARVGGETGDVSYFLTGGYEATDNDAPHHEFNQYSTALRVEGKVNPKWTIGTTFRGLDVDAQDLDTSYSWDGDSAVDSVLSTVYAVGKISDCWTARFHAGYYQENYDQTYMAMDWNTYLPAPGAFFTDLEALSLSTDHEITLRDDLRMLVGAFAYLDSYDSSTTGGENGDRYGMHSTLEWDILKDLTATGSLRWEDYDSFGDEWTWRMGSIYNIKCTGTTVRGGVGSSFRSPTYMELYGSTLGSLGNAALDAESALGWDLGVTQKICDNHELELTWFQNHITDQIIYESWSAPPVNHDGLSKTQGLELGMNGSWLDHVLSYRLAWTYLIDFLPGSGQPRNAVTASLDWRPTDKILVGAGATHLSDHSWGGEALGSSFVTRLYGSYQLTENVKLHARVENLLDEQYDLFSGWGSVAQASGTGVYAGVTIDW